jgi:hypothetical protein
MNLRLAWRVLRHGLPDAEVNYSVSSDGQTATFRFSVDYEGVSRGFIDGQRAWARGGTLTVEQKVATGIVLAGDPS